MTPMTEAESPVPTTTTTTIDEEHEDPSLSSAGLCIQFHMLGYTFGPVYTHQAFAGETIRGYHPPLQRLLEAAANYHKSTPTCTTSDNNNNNIRGDSPLSSLPRLHSSHGHHETATQELAITVTLAPSCQTCQVVIVTEPKRSVRLTTIRRTSKRRRLTRNINSDNSEKVVPAVSSSPNQDNNSDEEASENNSEFDVDDDDEEDDDGDSEFEAEEGVSDMDEEEEDNNYNNSSNNGSSNHNGHDKEGPTRHSRMPTNEILECMKNGLPDVRETTKAANHTIKDHFLRRPIGVELKEYSVHKYQDFVVSLATGVEASHYHTEIQRLALWFIETADDVDVASREGGFWNVLYLFRKHKRTQYSLAGYITLFYFHAPFKKPTPGLVVRICQALILPPYQRAGHGKLLLKCVMDIAHGRYEQVLSSSTNHKRKKQNNNNDNDKTNNIVEMNVESPAPAFVMLRNRTDYECFLQSLQDNQDPWIESLASTTKNTSRNKCNVTDPDFFTSLPDSDLIQAAAKAKIIPRQIQIVWELYKLRHLQDYFHANASINIEEKETLEKQFRLLVKKRLNKEHRENLSGLRTKAEKQAFLEEEFHTCLESYQKTLSQNSKQHQ